MRRPIITTDTAGCSNVVLQGKSGFLCEPQSVMDLKRCMMKVCELGPDRMSDFGRTGRQHIEENYDETLVIARYQEVLSQLLLRTSH